MNPPTATIAKATIKGKMEPHLKTQQMLEEARRLGKKFNLDGVIILGLTKNEYACASYGKDKARCKLYGMVLDKICDKIDNGELI